MLTSTSVVLLQVGDGTTSVVVLAGEFLKEAKLAIEDGVHSQIIIKGYREACRLVKQKIRELAVDISGKDLAYVSSFLMTCSPSPH
jgi:T-complex protein 1 subunit eta